MTKIDEKLNNKQATFDSCKPNCANRRKRTSHIVIAVAISIYLLAILFRQEVFVGGSCATLALLSFVVGFPFVTLYSLSTYFKHAENIKAGIFIVGSLSAFFIVYVICIGALFLDIFFPQFLSAPLTLLLTPLGVAIAIVTYAVSFGRVSKLGRISIIVLTVLFMMMLPEWLSRTLPYVYTPPALTSDRLSTYNQCIQFVKEHDEYKDLTLFRWGWKSRMNNTFFSVGLFGPRSNIQGVSTDEFSEMKDLYIQLSRELSSSKIRKVQRDGNMLVFYTNGNFILPVPPGVLYSLDGENPNTIDSELLDASKPFIRIAGDWYMSRRLVLVGLRAEIPIYNPKSIIDHSLRTEGLKLDDSIPR